MRHIQEGPVQKNKALQDVEFVLHCLLGLTTTDDKDNEYFIPQASAVVIQKNSAGHIMVTCPNNRTYNLSCALKNANLAYFTFTQALHETLLKSPEKYAALIIPLSNPLLHPEDSDRPIFSLEEAAIRFYTSEQYKIMNKLLRGQETDLTNKEWQLYFIVSLLAISGANKNVASQTDEKKFIYRFLHHLPLGFATQILLNREPQHLAGLTSFSEKTTGSDYFVGRRPFKITLANRGRVKDIKPVSQVPDAEEEVLFTTMDVYYEKDTSDENAVTAYLIYGPSTEINDHYLSESALSYAYENYLRHAYTDEAHKSNDGIERPNHALAHHVRAAFYTDSVIDYFSRFGSTDLQYFCQALSHQEKEMIKVFEYLNLKVLLANPQVSDRRDSFVVIGQKQTD